MISVLSFYVRVRTWMLARLAAVLDWLADKPVVRAGLRQEGQTTAEYALVILAAAAVAVVLITWARSSGKLPAFFDKIIDDITNSTN